jgi:hypothetical protein
MPYLMSGHKNTLRKIAPGALWGGPDGAIYLPTDDHYGSGSTYNWTNGTVTLGWCDPISAVALNGLGLNDPKCQYPYYTLANSHAPANYTPVAPTAATGGVRNAYYILGGWQNYGGSSNPANTHLGTIFDGGFTGGLYPNGNFDCARCHATGYNFDASGPEPTSNTNGRVTAIPDAKFSRIPTDGYIAPGTNGTSSWFLTGVQCERCHNAGTGAGSHPWYPVNVSQPMNEAATALCLECHRAEVITPANASAIPPTPGSITPTTTLTTRDHGYCSDLSGSAYSACISNSGNTWIYKPFIQHEAGPEFLNSPHARFSGSLIPNAQHSADLSVSVSGAYQSQFSENPADSTKNSGCTGCHDPHQSTIASVNATAPYLNKCVDCHSLSQNLLATVNHPQGQGTPFPTGTSADVPGSCAICHMVAANGTAGSHLFRINTDANYRTFPTPDQLYNQQITALGTAPDVSPLSGTTYPNAAWLDVDLACGQCHVGNDGVTTAYGLTLPPGMPGAHAYTKSQLAYWASVMHPGDNAVPQPTFNPPPTTYHTIQTVTISESMSGTTIYYTTDGSIPTTNSAVYSAPITVSTTTTIKAMATYPNVSYPKLLPSGVVAGTYSIVLPQAAAPTFSPTPSTYSGALSVTLSASAGLSIYYTTDGSTPTTNSTLYTGAISVSMNTTINAIAAGTGYLPSAVASGTYYIQGPAPTFSPASGTYYTSQSVTLSDAVSGATIYYTTNGASPTTSSASCSNPCTITVPATTTIKAMAAGGGYSASNVTVATYTIAAATPTFSLGSGTYNTPQSVTLSDATSGVTIYYTTNGLTPSTSSKSCSGLCTLTISSTTTVKAMAVGSGISQSSIAFATYTIAALAPTFSPGSTNSYTPVSVTLSDATSGTTIYYTTNGTSPTTSSNSCSNPCTITVSTTGTIKAMAAGGGYDPSNVAFATYTISAMVPTFTPGSGTYTGAQSVTLSDATSGVTLYYTTNGTSPTTSSNSCSNPCTITVSASETIKAMAIGNGFSQSNVGFATYTIH